MKKNSSSMAAKNDMMVATTANILVTCKRGVKFQEVKCL